MWSWIQFKDYISSSWDFRKCFPSSPLLNMSEQIYCRTKLHNATQQDHISNNLFSARLCTPKYPQTVDDWPMDCIHCVQMPSLFIQRCKNWTECLKMELEVFQYIYKNKTISVERSLFCCKVTYFVYDESKITQPLNLISIDFLDRLLQNSYTADHKSGHFPNL